MNKFEHMEDFVNKLCEALENNPQDFVFNPHTFTMKGSKTVFWNDDHSGIICKTWNGYTTDTVFSEQQGRRIKKSYEVARSKVASEKQKEVLKMFDESCTKSPPPLERIGSVSVENKNKFLTGVDVRVVLITLTGSIILNILTLLEIYK